jgi:DNA repair exonuclease SbcCD ATPase subunit
MKILELNIRNVRGIREELSLNPQGENYLIFGPNGSGKSSVVDALDFLLTGSISRLTGEGTKEISPKKHGPHIDEKPKEAVVRAKIRVPGRQDSIEIERAMSKPNDLNYSDSDQQRLARLLNLVRRRTHVLTRREILKYVTAEPGKRAEEVQAVLNISEIEQIRKVLVSLQNDCKKGAEADERSAMNAEAQVKATLGHTECDQKAILEVVNEKRLLLGGTPIETLVSTQIKTGLIMPANLKGSQSLNVSLLLQDLEKLLKASEENQSEVAAIDKLREIIATLENDTTLLKEMSRRDLTEKGLNLLDESGKCPLCDTIWKHGQLREMLQERLAKADVAARHGRELEIEASKLRSKLDVTKAIINSVLQTISQLKIRDAEKILDGWKNDLEQLNLALIKPIHSNFRRIGVDSSKVRRMMAPENLSSAISSILDSMPLDSEASEEQTSWDLLTRLEENLKALAQAQRTLKKSTELRDKAAALLESFERARDKVLGDLYQQVAERFVEMYRTVHGADENGFAAEFQADGAALNFAVEFHGRGMYPPHALHSEGHQDSMGLCLYLALNEHLSRGEVDLIILDDVIMSVDANHRRGICRLLKKFFRGRQFLITTHDKTWEEQLRREGVVKKSNIVEFYDWQLDTGPKLRGDIEIWDHIREDLRANNVPGAAHKLRRGSEQFFQIVCSDLSAPVTYDIEGRYELGDLVNGAVSHFKSLLRKAKAAASSWDDRKRLDELKAVEEIFDPIDRRVHAEWLFVNSEVHYNNWSNLSPEDFKPVADAFHELWNLFRCNDPECLSVLRLTRHGTAEDSITCSCGAVNWKLTVKPKKK